jgi:Pyruvate/2-oxoacid:ferredoxin oxidoreductase delta subunit
MNRQQAAPIPVTDALIDCFELVVAPEEADFLLRLGTESHSRTEIAARFGWPKERFDSFFDNLLRKGLIWYRRDADERGIYTLAPILLGWFELQLCRGRGTPAEREFARRVDRLFQSWGRFNVFPLRPLQNLMARRRYLPGQSIAAPRSPSDSGKRAVIPVARTVEVKPSEIWPTGNVRELILRNGRRGELALLHCFCRQWRNHADDPCRFDFPAESCMGIGPFTDQIVEQGFGRRIEMEEALAVAETVRKAGAIHTVFHEGDDVRRPQVAICNCCWDCCGVLGSYNRGIIPLKLAAHVLARVAEPDACVACGRCERFCPVSAVRVSEERPAVDSSRCIGCGQCAIQCPVGCFALERADRVVTLPLEPRAKARIPAN